MKWLMSDREIRVNEEVELFCSGLYTVFQLDSMKDQFSSR